MAHLNTDASVVFLAGRAFHSHFINLPQRTLSLNFVLVRGILNSLVFVDQKRLWPENVGILVVVSVM